MQEKLFLRKYKKFFNPEARKIHFPKYKKNFFWKKYKKFFQSRFFIFGAWA